MIVTLTPNVCKVCCRRSAVSFNSFVESPDLPTPFCKRDNGGNIYVLGFFFSAASISFAICISDGDAPSFTGAGFAAGLTLSAGAAGPSVTPSLCTRIF